MSSTKNLQKRILNIPSSKLRITENGRLDYPETLVVCKNRTISHTSPKYSICNRCVLGLSTDYAICYKPHDNTHFYLCEAAEEVGKPPFWLPHRIVLEPDSIDENILFHPDIMEKDLYKKLLPVILSIYENKFTQEINTKFINLPI